MNPDVRDKWVEALLSGEFVKGIGALRKPTETEALEHCCLGVLTELYHRETGNGKWILAGDESCYRFEVDGTYESSAGFLTDSVRIWAGLPNCNPDVDGETLSNANDTGLSFEQIADLIKHRQLS